MRTLALKFLVLLCPAVLALSAAGTAKASDCSSASLEGVSFRYCLTRNAGESVLYFLHAAQADETQWERSGPFSGAALEGSWRRAGRALPSVISISFGPTWILTSEKAVKLGAALPALEKKLLGSSARRRLLAGTSMGGLNAGLLAIANPSLFERAALLCPAVSPLNPFASPAEQAQFKRATPGVNQGGLDAWTALFRPLYGTAEGFERERLERKAASARASSTLFLVAFNERDQLGFAPGALALESAARGRLRVGLERVGGGHCKNVFTENVARFLSP